MSAYLGAWINVIICMGLPVIILGYILIKKRNYLPVFFLGVLCYFVSQVLTRTPALSLLQDTNTYRHFNVGHPYLTLFLLAVSAALFEEIARYFLLLRSRRYIKSLHIPIVFGLGHGGLEALVVGINNLYLAVVLPNYLLRENWTVVLAGFERISVMMAQIVFTTIVYVSVQNNKKIYLLLAIILHTLYDFSLVFLYFGISPVAFELLLLVVSLIMLILAVKKLKGKLQQ